MPTITAPRPSTRACARTLASSPVKIASPIRKWPMLSSAICGMAAIGMTLSKVSPWPACGSMPFLTASAAQSAIRFSSAVALLAFDMGVAAGVELDDRRAKANRRVDLRSRRLDEQADADAGVRQACRHNKRGDRAARRRRARPRSCAPRAARGRCRRRAAYGAARSRASPRSPPFRGSAAGRSRPSAGRCRGR